MSKRDNLLLLEDIVESCCKIIKDINLKSVIANGSEAILYIKALNHRLLQNCVFRNDVIFYNFGKAIFFSPRFI